MKIISCHDEKKGKLKKEDRSVKGNRYLLNWIPSDLFKNIMSIEKS